MQSELKVCSMCGEAYGLGDFHVQKGKPLSRCKFCERARIRAWGQRNRSEVLEHYGPNCACCGETRNQFLGIDHIEGGGGKHRKSINTTIYYWLWKNNFPKGYRVLCHNCNQSRGVYGFCPHQLEKGEITEEQAIALSPRIKDLRTLSKEGKGEWGKHRLKAKAVSSKKTYDKAAYHREYAKANRQQIRKNRRDWSRRIKEEVIAHYGGKCLCCSERMSELLRVVPQGDNPKAPGRMSIYYWLRREKFPKGYVVYCAGCDHSLSTLGFCPHSQAAI